MNTPEYDFFSDYPVFIEFGAPPCSESDPDSFFPVETEFENKVIGSSYHDLEMVKAICRTCPYQIKCLDYGLEHNEIGIWGGLTEAERKNYRRRLRISVKK